ncbi:MAG: hypothetical protein ACJATN_001840 [Neolewinella sp.]|jgi:hypothetical protein
MLEDNLDSAGTTSTIDDDLAIDAPTAAIEDTSFTYQMLHLVDSLYLPTGYEDDLRTGFNGEVTALQVTSGSAAFQQVVSNFLHRLLDAPMGGPTNEAFYLRYLEQRKKAYRKEMEPQIGNDEVNFGYFNSREEVPMKAALNKSELFTLSTYRYYYGGGAYGNYGTTLLSFTDNPARALSKEDIFAGGNDEAIGKMLKHADATRLYETPTIPVTKNLGLTTQGVEFIYLPYEIDTRGNGHLNITLPLDTLLMGDLLTPYGRTLLERLR